MARRRKEVARASIVKMAKGGASISKITQETKATKKHCCDRLKKFPFRGNVQTAKRSGRPPKTTPRDDKRLQKLEILQSNYSPLVAARQRSMFGYNFTRR